MIEKCSDRQLEETGPLFLAIDDSEISLLSIERALRAFGFNRLTSFTDPAKAIDALSNGELCPDIIIIDYLMPKMNGIEACARIRLIETTSDVPIILLTGQGSTETLANAFLAGANDYVSKPFEKIEFEARIRSCLRLKSELDRRKTSEAFIASARNTVAQIEAKCDVSLAPIILSSEGFHAVISAVHSSEWPRVSLLVMKLQSVSKLTPLSPTISPEATAAILARVEVPAGALFAPLDTQTFCCAIFDSHRKEVEIIAKRFKEAVLSAKLIHPQDASRRPLQLNVAVRNIANGMTLGSALADAIRSAQINGDGNNN